jgi:high-affinity K+ transport system ATPase subunit B
MSDIKIEYSEMGKDMVNRVVQLVRDIERTKMDKDVALAIKKEFDARFH